MNICFLSGKIISIPRFRFILNKKYRMKKSYHRCVLITDLEINGELILKLNFYDEAADYYFKILELNDEIFISGNLNENYEIEVDECYKW